MDQVRVGGADIAVLVLYFMIVLGAGFLAMCRSRVNSVQGYFMAGRFMTWIPVGASLFASNIGSEHFIGLAGSGASKGIAVGAFEFNAAILLQLLGWVFLPVYISSGVFTLPDYMRKRFGGSKIQIYLSLLSLSLYIFTKISVNLYSGSLFIIEALGWNLWAAIVFIIAITALVTISGGLAAVLYTDLVQTVVMLVGATLLTAIGFNKIGGFTGLLEDYGKSISGINVGTTAGEALILNVFNVANSSFSMGIDPTVDSIASSPNISSNLTCALPSRSAFVMLRGIDDPEMPWLGYMLGQTPASIWYWCADQMMVQRALAAKSLAHAQGATLMAGFIKLLPLFIIVMPGMISRILYPDTVGCGTAEECYRVCKNRYGCSDLAYPKLVMGVMPDGLRGLMLAVMLAAIISDLTSIFNSSSTLFTVDIYPFFRRKASNRELMVVGRLFVLLMAGLSILWVLVIRDMQGGQLYIYIQSISGFLAPPIAAVYIMALLWKRNNELGAFTGLMYGFLIGITRMIMNFVYTDPVCGVVDPRPWLVAKVHYMYFAMFSFFSTSIVMCVVSLFSAPPSEEQIRGLTFWTRNDGLASKTVASNPTANVDAGAGGTRLVEKVNISDELADKSDTISDLSMRKSSIDEPGNNYGVSGDVSEMDEEVKAESANTTCCRCLHISGHFCKWYWGFVDFPCPKDVNCPLNCAQTASIQQETVNVEHLQFDSVQMSQSRSTKVTLLMGLVMIISSTVFLLCFFSFYFGPITRGPLQIVGNTSSLETLQAISFLKSHGLIAN